MSGLSRTLRSAAVAKKDWAPPAAWLDELPKPKEPAHGKHDHLGLQPHGWKAGEGPLTKDAYLSRNIERIGVWGWNNYLHKWDWGLLPKGYDEKVHGPFVPWRYYGKMDTPLKDVKLGELSAWIGRREKGVLPAYREGARMWHLWQQRFGYGARYQRETILWQFIALMIVLFYPLSLPVKRMHKQARYHW